MERLTILGMLLVAMAVAFIVVVPMESGWKWPVIILFLIVGFILMFLGFMQRPRSGWGSSRQLGGEEGPFNIGTVYPRGSKGSRESRSDSDSDSGGGDGGD